LSDGIFGGSGLEPQVRWQRGAQQREVLMQTYGDNINTMLQEATTTVASASEGREDAPF